MAVVFISTMIFITAPIVGMSIVNNVNAADKGPVTFATIFLVLIQLVK